MTTDALFNVENLTIMIVDDHDPIRKGIKRIVAGKDYHASAQSKAVFKDAGVRFDLLSKETEKYADMAADEE